MKRTEKPFLVIIQMSKLFMRLGTGFLLLVLVWSCASVPGLREDSTNSYIRVPFVRVLVGDDVEKLQVSADNAFAIECLRDGEQHVYYSGQPITIVNKNRLLTVIDNGNNVIESSLNEVNIIPRGSGNRLKLNKNRYRGIVQALPKGQTIQTINIIYMEDYLRGVVPPEIGPRKENELEAVKAQAVAARTYAMAHLKQYGKEPYDMKSSIIDQQYDGANVENRLVNRAIDETAGRILMYNDEFITAYYHSTCGGETDDIEDVWDKKEVPYLKSVQDNGACSWSKYYTWREKFTEKQLRGRIEQYLASDRGRDLRIGKIHDVVIQQRTPGGRVAKLLVKTENENYRFYKDRIRWIVGRTSNPDLILPSDRFDVTIDRNAGGEFLSIEFKGRGYGHGVGMCQCGAIGHARNGWKFDSILSLYYTDSQLKKLY